MAPEDLVGSWLIAGGDVPNDQVDRSVNPLAADGLATFHSDGTVIVCGAPSYGQPVGGQSRIYVPAAHGTWHISGNGHAKATVAAVLYEENGRSVATLNVDAGVENDRARSMLVAHYSVKIHQSRWWSANLSITDGTCWAWRIPVRP